MKRSLRHALVLLGLVWGCGSSQPPSPYTSVTYDAGAPALEAGETCDPTTAPQVVIRFDPPQLVLAPGQFRPVRVYVDPDLCAPLVATVELGSKLLETSTSFPMDLRHPYYDLQVQASAQGPSSSVATSLTVTLPPRPVDLKMGFPGDPKGTHWTGTLPIQVVPSATPATCTSTGAAPTSVALSVSQLVLKGMGQLADASLSVPIGGFQGSSQPELTLKPFSATLSCAGDLSGNAQPSTLALGPAVSFVPSTGQGLTQSLRRELGFSVPVNPAAMPSGARMRHVEVLYQGPLARTPRPMTVANPHFVKQPDQSWVLAFESPWFGTYQAVVPRNAGTVALQRTLQHRAVVGFSMGGGGAATFGVRHHNQFDAIAPMGGPSDWSWLNWFVEHYALGGFCPASQPGCPTYGPEFYPMTETFAHTEDYNHFWYQTGSGNGGTFSRNSYLQIFEDLALMQGNPNGENADPQIPFMAPGLSSSTPFVSGGGVVVNGAAQNCAVSLDPISPNSLDSAAMQTLEAQQQTAQQAIQNACLAARCNPKNAAIFSKGYYDAAYNPDGTEQVISFCDGGENPAALGSPYIDTFAPFTPAPPVNSPIATNIALVVDLNKNGVRDLGEPVLRQGHEPWSDFGTDGIADAQEPNYDPVTNPDPDQDDYDFQLNPNGTENDHRYEAGEPFQDFGLDGVPNTPQLSNGGYDFGEGDGKFTMSSGLASFYANDPHSILAGWSSAPAGPLDVPSLEQFDIWSDGGVRDLFNFESVANHFEGAIAARTDTTGQRIKTTAFYNNFENLPGEDPTQPNNYLASNVLWADVAGAPSMRYGYVDATSAQIQQGDGMHVGTASQILYRLVTSFYFAANRWPDADRTLPAAVDSSNPLLKTVVSDPNVTCNVNQTDASASCETYFTGPSTKRVGPLGITLPPGYALENNSSRGVRYPVIFVLHGYGQEPQDLEATAAITNNYMTDSTRSSYTRLAKMIAVYVDGRCRNQTLPDGVTTVPECIEGTFYLNANRKVVGKDGVAYPIARLDDWFEEVLTYVNQNFRTMGTSNVSVVE